METWIALLTVACSAIGITWISAWWLSKQFTDVRKLIHSKTEQLETAILDKLEYHEKHDDNRFSQLTTQMWEMRLAQALKGKVLDQEDSKPRASGT